jgi:hypothetical protein
MCSSSMDSANNKVTERDALNGSLVRTVRYFFWGGLIR